LGDTAELAGITMEMSDVDMSVCIEICTSMPLIFGSSQHVVESTKLMELIRENIESKHSRKLVTKA
jgi:hypothetical protein